jgi:phage repressor protein C with HTH and peptisase S24 domain
MMRQLKTHLGFRKESELADYLGIKSNTLSTWYARNTFDAMLIFSKCDFVSPRWLLTGEGEMVEPQKLDPFKNGVDNINSSFFLEIIRQKDQEISKLNQEIGALREKVRYLTDNPNLKKWIHTEEKY